MGDDQLGLVLQDGIVQRLVVVILIRQHEVVLEEVDEQGVMRKEMEGMEKDGILRFYVH